MASISSMRDDLQDELEDQISSLRKELSALRKDVSKRSARAYRGTKSASDDFLDVLRDYYDEAMPSVRRGAHAVERTARDNPKTTIATAVVGVAVLGLAAAFFARR